MLELYTGNISQFCATLIGHIGQSAILGSALDFSERDIYFAVTL
jgi:hypothetical protein